MESFVDRHGVLCFVRPGGQDLIVRDPDPVDVALVHRLSPPGDTRDALAGGLGLAPSSIQEKLDSLVAADLVLVRATSAGRPLEGEDAERFSRQLPYLAELGDELRLQRRLRDSTVVVVGCGGLGTWAIASLACIGVGSVVLVDDDTVALSNLNRQILYTRVDVGRPKVEATASWLREFDPAISVECAERRIAAPGDLDSLVAPADAVVLAADWPPYDIGRWVNRACVAAKVPFIVAGQVPPVLKVGPTYAPGDGACFACHERALARESHAYEDYVAFHARENGTATTVGPASCVAGGLIGLELLHLLTGHPCVTRDLTLIVHMRTLEVRREPLVRDPACETCKHLE